LTSKADYQQVFKAARVSQDRCFRILARLSVHPHARLGLAVSTRVSKSAVERNRLKRLVRESFRHHRHQLEVNGQGLDLVVLPGFKSVNLSNDQLRESLNQHWQKLPRQVAAGATAASGRPERP
jgi:ribonuclease P protein component